MASGERDCNGNLCMSLNNGTSYLWQFKFPLQLFLVANFFTPFPPDCILTSTPVPSLGFVCKPYFSALGPHLHQQTDFSGWDMQGCGMDLFCRSHSVLSATDRFMCSPLIDSKVPFLSQLISPLVKGFPQIWESLRSFNSHAKVHRSHPISSFLPFPLFFLSS